MCYSVVDCFRVSMSSPPIVMVNGTACGTRAAQATTAVSTPAAFIALPAQPRTDGEGGASSGEAGEGMHYQLQYVDPLLYHQPEGVRAYTVYESSVEGGCEGGEAWAVPAYSVLVEAEGATHDTEGEAEGSEGGEGADTAEGNSDRERAPPATVQWLLTHYEGCEGVSVPRSTLYGHYLRHCRNHRPPLAPVNAASFGKLIRSVFINLRTRRLGTRGNSKYHYYGIRAKPHVPPQPSPSPPPHTDSERGTPPPPAAVEDREVIWCPGPAPGQTAEWSTLWEGLQEFGTRYINACIRLEAHEAGATLAAWWAALGTGERALLGSAEGSQWMERAHCSLARAALDAVCGAVMRPLPPHHTHVVRAFGKALEGEVCAALEGAGAGVGGENAAGALAGARRLAGALRRRTSLQHLAAAARAVLHNPAQVSQMRADLCRVDWAVVREHAAWPCAGAGAPDQQDGVCRVLRAAEHEVKARLGRQTPLEQWARWLDSVVERALEGTSGVDTESAGRMLLLRWGHCSSLVIRELTLRSAASFGSFHLIRLLFDEYLAHAVDMRLASSEQ